MAREYLIVDDSPVIVQTLKKMLVRLGSGDADIHTAGSSEEGLKVFHEVKPDVVFMDVKLPDQDGEETTREILQAEPDTRVVVITGLMEDDERVRNLISMGAFEFLQKPIHSEDVGKIIQLLDQEESGAGRIR